MALINCPNCSKTISDKAIACPHCGSIQSTVTQQNDHSYKKLTTWQIILWYALKVAVVVLIVARIIILLTNYASGYIYIYASNYEYVSLHVSTYVPFLIWLLLLSPIKKKNLRLLSYSFWGLTVVFDILIVSNPYNTTIAPFYIISKIILFLIIALSYRSLFFTIVTTLLIINNIHIVPIILGIFLNVGNITTAIATYAFSIFTYSLLLFIPKKVWERCR